jgi:hypothetical protein
MTIMHPDRTAAAQEKPQVFPIVYSFEQGQPVRSRYKNSRTRVTKNSRLTGVRY